MTSPWPRGAGTPSIALRAATVLPDRVLPDAVVTIDGDRIASVRPVTGGEPGLPARIEGVTILPGLVDVHTHGAATRSFSDTDDPLTATRTVVRAHLEHGTTTVVASLVTARAEEMLNLTEGLGVLASSGEIAGIHLEGPFLSPAKRGAHDPRHLRLPDPGLLDDLLAAGGGMVRHVTVAPELPGGLELVASLAARGVVAAVGHSDADFATATMAFDAGARLATHLFNGMRGWGHRDAGVVPAALAAAARGDAVVELIADGVHLDRGTVAAVLDLLEPDRVVFVSDAMSAAGAADGRYRLGPMTVLVRDGVARIDDGTGSGSIAGSTSFALDLVRFVHLTVGAPLADAVRSASLSPARLFELDGEVGALRPGLRADLVLVDDALAPLAVVRAGEWSYGAGDLPLP